MLGRLSLVGLIGWTHAEFDRLGGCPGDQILREFLLWGPWARF